VRKRHNWHRGQSRGSQGDGVDSAGGGSQGSGGDLAGEGSQDSETGYDDVNGTSRENVVSTSQSSEGRHT